MFPSHAQVFTCLMSACMANGAMGKAIEACAGARMSGWGSFEGPVEFGSGGPDFGESERIWATSSGRLCSSWG